VPEITKKSIISNAWQGIKALFSKNTIPIIKQRGYRASLPACNVMPVDLKRFLAFIGKKRTLDKNCNLFVDF